MSEELVEQIARLICEWNDDNPDASLGGDGQNFLWMEVAETLVRPKIMPRIEVAKVEGVRLGIEAAAKVSAMWLDPVMATDHENDTYRSIIATILALKDRAAQIAGGSDAD